MCLQFIGRQMNAAHWTWIRWRCSYTRCLLQRWKWTEQNSKYVRKCWICDGCTAAYVSIVALRSSIDHQSINLSRAVNYYVRWQPISIQNGRNIFRLSFRCCCCSSVCAHGTINLTINLFIGSFDCVTLVHYFPSIASFRFHEFVILFSTHTTNLRFLVLYSSHAISWFPMALVHLLSHNFVMAFSPFSFARLTSQLYISQTEWEIWI